MIDLVDEIAYNHHDVDDGLDSGLLDPEPLAREVPIFGDALAAARRAIPGADLRQVHTAALSRMIDELVTGLIDATSRNVDTAGVRSVDDVRGAHAPMVALPADTAGRNLVLKSYLRENLYRHPRIESMKAKARRTLLGLFERYGDNPRLLPRDRRARIDVDGLERTIADYIAGMTDRYAAEEYRRLFNPAM
jgi:dGTPase